MILDSKCNNKLSLSCVLNPYILHHYFLKYIYITPYVGKLMISRICLSNLFNEATSVLTMTMLPTPMLTSQNYRCFNIYMVFFPSFPSLLACFKMILFSLSDIYDDICTMLYISNNVPSTPHNTTTTVSWSD